MNLQKLIFTENACYKAGATITPKGIMVHSTGANNPNLKRYVGPDDGKLGVNKYGNHWNQPMDRQVCVHAFIGKLEDGTIATYQTLPWNHRGWHCGGAGNNTLISFEICEDNLTDANYFNAVYKEAVELCAYLCKQFNLTEKSIICHSEGYKQGIASGHADVMHWFPKHGKSMDTFRADVKAMLNVAKEEAEKPTEPNVEPVKPEETNQTLYRVQVGAFSKKANAEHKLQAVKDAGFDAFVTCTDDKLWRVQVGAYAEKANADKMQQKLQAAGFSGYVTKLGGVTATTNEAKKSIEEVAKEVLHGLWGNGAERKKKLAEAGYNYTEVQKKVNELLK